MVRRSKHVKLVKRVNDVVNKVEQIKLFTDHEVKGSCKIFYKITNIAL